MTRLTLLICLYVLLSFKDGKAQTSPNFSFEDMGGYEHDLYEALSEGKTILLFFFFVDCDPCKTMVQSIKKIEADYKDYDLEIWAVSDRDALEKIRAFEKKSKSYFSFGGKYQGGHPIIHSIFANQFEFSGFPTLSIISNNRTIQWDIWADSFEEIESEIRKGLDRVKLKKKEGNLLPEISNVLAAPTVVFDKANIQFDLSKSAFVEIKVFNLLGKPLGTSYSGSLSKGDNSVSVDLSEYPKGNYFIRIEADGQGAKVIKLIHITP